jgi:hypothetical protein
MSLRQIKDRFGLKIDRKIMVTVFSKFRLLGRSLFSLSDFGFRDYF